jgi:iron complex outermembrane receptor protein
MSIQSIVCASLSFSLFAASASAADLAVRVVDLQQAPIPVATVSLISRDGARRVATTDAAGASRFTGVAPGEYLLDAAAVGFRASSPQTVSLDAKAEVPVTISLGLAEIRSTVVVTASGTPQTTDEVSKSLTVVDASTIDLRADHSVGDALSNVAGLHVQQLGGPGSTMYFKIRGLRNTDTAILVDGMRLRDASGTQADASGTLQDLVIADPGRIEVLRGTGSALYGTDATGGVVNIVTDDGGGLTHGSVSVDGGSLGSARGTARLGGGMRNDRVRYSLGVTHWNVTSGVDGDSPARNTSGQGRVSLRLSQIARLTARLYAGDSFGFVRLSPRSIGTLPPTGIVDAVPLSLDQEHLYESGTPMAKLVTNGATFIPAAYNSDSTRAGRFLSGAFRFELRPSERLGFTTEYQNVRTDRNYGDGPAGPGSQPAGNNLSVYQGRIQTANARLDYAPSRSQQIDAGYEYENEDFRNRLTPPPPVGSFYSDISQRSQAVFAQDQIHLFSGRLQLAAGWRTQFFSLQAPEYQPVAGAPFAGRSFAAPPSAQTGDASAAYTLRATGTKIRAHAGRGYRAPSLYERFGVFYSGTSYTLYGDPSLRPDRTSSIDGGIDQKLWNSRVSLSATYFYTRLNEAIIFDTSGAVTPLTDPLGRNGGYRNTRGGLARGTEFTGSAAATRSLELTAAYTYTDARERTPLVPGVWQSYEIPRHQFSAFATERITSQWIAALGYGATSNYLASVSGRAFRFDGYSRAFALLSYRHPIGDRRAIRLYGNAANLFNQTYFEKGYRVPGVTITSGMQVEF